MLAGKVKKHRVGMFSGLLEILGFLVVTLRFDIGLYKKLYHSEKTRLLVLLKKID